MKYSISTTFSRLALVAFIVVTLLAIGGGGVIAPNEGVPWIGWLYLHHPTLIWVAGFLMLWQHFEAWRHHSDHAFLLPLSTLSTVLFFLQAWLGAGDFPIGPTDILHMLTGNLLFLSLLSQLIAALLQSRNPRPEIASLDIKQRLKDFVSLSKPIIVLLLLVTTYAGMVVGGQAFPSLSLTFWTLLGGGLTAAGSAAINQYIDRNLDKLMIRTAKRPLAARRMFPAEGLAFGLAISLIGVYLLILFVNLLAAILSVVGLLYYVILYSVFLKHASTNNIVIGGGAGAIPPLVGWAATTGSLDLAAWALFAIIFLWTPPHFWALAIVRMKDYKKTGIPMLPVIRGEAETRKQILLYTIGLVLFTILVPLLSLAGNVYLISSLLLGGGLIYAAWRVFKIAGNKVAWQMYRISSMYLAFIFVALMIDAVV